MENYTLGLALFDYLPVIAAGFGLYLICGYCASLANYEGHWIVVIPAIALTGGVLKASWKLIYALNGVDHRWMSEQLFFFLAASYLLMGAFVLGSIRAGSKNTDLNKNWWYSPTLIAVIVLVTAQYLKLNTDGRTWSTMLLATLSLANLVMLLTLIVHCVKKRNWYAGGAFVTNLVLSYVLVVLARIPEQTADLQWLEEFLNLGNNSMLAIGAWALIRVRKRQGTQ
jgi:hypothetical protein